MSRLGQDSFGEMALNACKVENINTDYISFDEAKASGVALIMVDQDGENVIAVASGANNTLMPDDVVAAESAIQAADCVLLQLEIPLESVKTAVLFPMPLILLMRRVRLPLPKPGHSLHYPL